MSFIVVSFFSLAIFAFLLTALAYRFRYLQNAALYLPQMPPDSRTHCPNPSPAQGFHHYEILSIPTRDGITLRGYVVRPAAVSDASRQRAAAGNGSILGVGSSNNNASAAAAGVSSSYFLNSHNNNVGNTLTNPTLRSSSAVSNSGSASLSNVNGNGNVGIHIPAPPPQSSSSAMMANSPATSLDTTQTAVLNMPSSSGHTIRGTSPAASTGAGGGRIPSSSSPSAPVVECIPSPDTSDTEKGVIVYFHGNAGNVGHRLPIAFYLAKATGCAVVMVDYRGYGKSDDPPTGFTLTGAQFDRNSSNSNRSINNLSATSNPNSAFNSSSTAFSADRGESGGGGQHNDNLDSAAIRRLLADSASRGVTEEGLQMDAEAVLDYVTNAKVTHYAHYQRFAARNAAAQHAGAMSGGGGNNHNNSNTNSPTPSSGFAHPHGKVFVMGTSLGGAVTAYISAHEAFKDRVCGVIMENTFMSISEMVDEIAMKIFKSGGRRSSSASNQNSPTAAGGVSGMTGAHTAPVGGMRNPSPSSSPIVSSSSSSSNQTALQAIMRSALTDGSCLSNTILFTGLRILKPLTLFIGWDSGERISNISTPILFLSGRRDEIVPANQMDRLYGVAKKAQWKRFAKFTEGMHNDLPAKPGYFDVIGSFVKSVVEGGGSSGGGENNHNDSNNGPVNNSGGNVHTTMVSSTALHVNQNVSSSHPHAVTGTPIPPSSSSASAVGNVGGQSRLLQQLQQQAIKKQQLNQTAPSQPPAVALMGEAPPSGGGSTSMVASSGHHGGAASNQMVNPFE